MSLQFEDAAPKRFKSISWHDSKLNALSFYKAEGEDRVKLSIDLLAKDGSLASVEVVFLECVYFEANVYLEAKSMCADDISTADCREASEWKNAVSDPSPFDVTRNGRNFDNYFHFSIVICPPGGTINVLARDFVLVHVNGDELATRTFDPENGGKRGQPA